MEVEDGGGCEDVGAVNGDRAEDEGAEGEREGDGVLGYGKGKVTRGAG